MKKQQVWGKMCVVIVRCGWEGFCCFLVSLCFILFCFECGNKIICFLLFFFFLQRDLELWKTAWVLGRLYKNNLLPVSASCFILLESALGNGSSCCLDMKQLLTSSPNDEISCSRTPYPQFRILQVQSTMVWKYEMRKSWNKQVISFKLCTVLNSMMKSLAVRSVQLRMGIIPTSVVSMPL